MNGSFPIFFLRKWRCASVWEVSEVNLVDQLDGIGDAVREANHHAGHRVLLARLELPGLFVPVVVGVPPVLAVVEVLLIIESCSLARAAPPLPELRVGVVGVVVVVLLVILVVLVVSAMVVA